MTEKEWRTTLAERRREAGMTQQKLADSAGVSVGTVSSIERGTGHPSRRIIDAIEFALLSHSFRRDEAATGRRMTVDEIARIFDMATVVPIDVADVAAYRVRMIG